MLPMRIERHPTYHWVDAAGRVLSSGALAAEPSYAEAMKIAREYSSYRGFQRLVLLSADFQAVSELLRNGSRPENIVTVPPILFREAPTPEGLQAVERLALELASAPPEGAEAPPAPPKRPFWRFW